MLFSLRSAALSAVLQTASGRARAADVPSRIAFVDVDEPALFQADTVQKYVRIQARPPFVVADGAVFGHRAEPGHLRNIQQLDLGNIIDHHNALAGIFLRLAQQLQIMASLPCGIGTISYSSPFAKQRIAAGNSPTVWYST